MQIYGRILKAIAASHVKIDAEERRRYEGKRIRYPSTNSVNDEWYPLVNISGQVNTCTIPPCEYGGKRWKQKN